MVFVLTTIECCDGESACEASNARSFELFSTLQEVILHIKGCLHEKLHAILSDTLNEYVDAKGVRVTTKDITRIIENDETITFPESDDETIQINCAYFYGYNYDPRIMGGYSKEPDTGYYTFTLNNNYCDEAILFVFHPVGSPHAIKITREIFNGGDREIVIHNAASKKRLHTWLKEDVQKHAADIVKRVPILGSIGLDAEKVSRSVEQKTEFSVEKGDNSFEISYTSKTMVVTSYVIPKDRTDRHVIIEYIFPY